MRTILEKAFAKQTLLACKGYISTFIDNATEIDFYRIVPGVLKSALPKVEGNKDGILNYTNLSVLYNSKRSVPFVSAYNVDGSKKSSTVIRANKFRSDPRIAPEIQLSQKGFYDLRKDITEFEIGHMAANNEMAWGKDAQLQSYQTFHFPNSVPQAEKLNTGIWKALETYIIDEAATVKGNKRVCVFTGPLLRDDDPEYVKDPKFRIPLLFYKVVVFPTKTGLFSTGFMMSHEQKMIEQKMFVKSQKKANLEMMKAEVAQDFSDFKYKKVFQVNIKYLEEQTGLKFSWKGVTAIPVPNDKNQIKKIRKIKDSKEAAAAEKELRKGVAPKVLSIEEELTLHEIKSKTYRLNIILP
jgi:DNA/RNA endonuclease G (NUC1)